VRDGQGAILDDTSSSLPDFAHLAITLLEEKSRSVAAMRFVPLQLVKAV
jgi:hypothetical protein